MNPAEATREICWNIQNPWLMYLLFAPVLTIALYGIYRRFRLWRCGSPAMRWDRPISRLGLLLRHGLVQVRLWRDGYAGLFHLFILSGFLALIIATLVTLSDYDLHTTVMRGAFYLYFQSLAVDLFGLILLVGIFMAAFRRWFIRPHQLLRTAEGSFILVAILLILFTGFLVEGFRIAATHDPWACWSPVGAWIASVSLKFLSAETIITAHAVGWWFHLFLAFGFLAWAPYTKLAHVITGPLNIFFADLDGHGRVLQRIDFEAKDATFGVNDLAHFSWKDLLDLDACTECGRCSAACPANASGKILSPRDIILGLRQLMHAAGPRLLSTRKGPNAAAAGYKEPLIPTIGDETALKYEALWACTTCAACMEACPVFVEHVPKIMDARRFLAMEEAFMPETLAEAVSSMEKRGHPFLGSRLSRLDWTEGLDIPVMADLDDPEKIDLLLWVGCAGALLERNHRVVRALSQLLRIAGVRFAILGREERCTGDPARRMGNEFLFETMARKVIDLLDRYKVKRIVTVCPHCFNTFRNDYPALGGKYAVEHHSTFLARLIEEGRLRPRGGDFTVTYHDPCYLGRYNRVFDAPRRIIGALTTSPLVEMATNRETSLCCGGGGGMSFIEEPAGHRVNMLRGRDALKTGADIVAVGCPFCTTMLEDGLAATRKDSPMAVKDIAELLFEAVDQQFR